MRSLENHSLARFTRMIFEVAMLACVAFSLSIRARAEAGQLDTSFGTEEFSARISVQQMRPSTRWPCSSTARSWSAALEGQVVRLGSPGLQLTAHWIRAWFRRYSDQQF